MSLDGNPIKDCDHLNGLVAVVSHEGVHRCVGCENVQTIPCDRMNMSDFLAPYKLVSTSLVLTYQCSAAPFTYACICEFSVSDSLMYSNAWFGMYHSYLIINYRSLSQQSPIKETIFCKRDLHGLVCITFTHLHHTCACVPMPYTHICKGWL